LAKLHLRMVCWLLNWIELFLIIRRGRYMISN